MLYINSKFVNLDSDTGEFSSIVKEYKEEIKRLRNRFGRYITVRSIKEPKVNETGLLEQPPNATIPLHIVVSGKNGREDWLYCETAPEMKDGVLVPDTTQKVVQYGELTIDLDNEPDFAYFFLTKHGMFKKGLYYILDVEAIEDEKAAARSKETALNAVLYGDNSPLVLDKTLLLLVAKRWGIGNADKLSRATIQNKLYDIVMEAETKKDERGVEAFLKDIKSSNDSDKLKVAATARDAIDTGVLIFDVLDKTWKINYQDGTYRNIVNVSIQDLSRKDEVLILYLQDDNHLYAQLVGAMGGEKPVSEVINIEKLRETNDRATLLAYARSLNPRVSAFAKSNDALKQEILKRVLETQNV